MFIATAIAADALTPQRLREVQHSLAAAGAEPGDPDWIDGGSAADLPLRRPPSRERPVEGVDVVIQRAADRRHRLLVSDMDSTMITVECIDELADYAGCKAEVSRVTERAMRGELDFAEALGERVALLEGLPVGTIDECLRERVRPMAGAATLLATLRAEEVRTMLVSGGFTRFAVPVGERLGFDRVLANVLEERDGRLTGRVLAPIVDGASKARALAEERDAGGLSVAQTLAIGDGANDLPMIRAAGLGIAFRAKPVVAAQANASIRHGDLTALLWARGLPRARWTTA